MGLFTTGDANSPVIKWEPLLSKGSEAGYPRHVFRAKVFGGWLVSLRTAETGGGIFVPDKGHEWDGNSL